MSLVSQHHQPHAVLPNSVSTANPNPNPAASETAQENFVQGYVFFVNEHALAKDRRRIVFIMKPSFFTSFAFGMSASMEGRVFSDAQAAKLNEIVIKAISKDERLYDYRPAIRDIRIGARIAPCANATEMRVNVLKLAQGELDRDLAAARKRLDIIRAVNIDMEDKSVPGIKDKIERTTRHITECFECALTLIARQNRTIELKCPISRLIDPPDFKAIKSIFETASIPGSA